MLKLKILFKNSPTPGTGALSPHSLLGRLPCLPPWALSPLPEFIFSVRHWLDKKKLAKNVFPCWDETIDNFLNNP